MVVAVVTRREGGARRRRRRRRRRDIVLLTSPLNRPHVLVNCGLALLLPKALNLLSTPPK